MRFLANMTIRTKLTAAVALATLLMIAIGVAGLWGTHSAQQAAESIYKDRLVAIDILNNVRNYQNQIRINLLVARQSGDSFEVMASADKVNGNIFKIAQLLEDYNKRKMGNEEKKLMDEFVKARLHFGQNGVVPMIDLMQADKFEAADKHRKQVVDPAFAKVSDAIDAVIKHQSDLAQNQFEQTGKQAKVIRVGSIAGILIGAVMALVMGMLIARSINQGVAALVKASASLADGDLTTHVPIKGKDELSRVGSSFNQMASQFSHLISEVNASSDQVNQTADGLSAAASQVAQGSRLQSEQAAAAANSVELLNAAFKEIAATSVEIVSAANNARELSSRGNQVVGSAVQGIEKVAKTVSESAVAISELGQRSIQIGQILSVIKDIADQTNLLALNAAIEAARAGEQGRGFAVVADEVRKLAERTTSATAEISTMVGAIQGDTQQAVETMRQSSDDVREGVALANEAGKALKDISRSVEQVVDMIGHIADSTRTQSDASESLTETVEGIARMAEENRRAIEHAVSDSREMTNRSKGLQGIISRFRLKAE
ncbi:MAG: methyl-accepting chemotaxis protein [Hydrogenophilales bacterium]|nr:methyl-accepting chemotaxis protein [Hydrogenophilales bacterium]